VSLTEFLKPSALSSQIAGGHGVSSGPATALSSCGCSHAKAPQELVPAHSAQEAQRQLAVHCIGRHPLSAASRSIASSTRWEHYGALTVLPTKMNSDLTIGDELLKEASPGTHPPTGIYASMDSRRV
jgi:hypothetical protein